MVVERFLLLGPHVLEKRAWRAQFLNRDTLIVRDRLSWWIFAVSYGGLITLTRNVRLSVLGIFSPFEILLNVYNSLVQPHFDYCNVVWGNCSKNLSSKLQKLQNRAARVLTFSNYDCSTSELFQNLKWSKLVHQRAVSKAIMMHSIVNNIAPEYLTFVFLFVAAI